jgi:undecaprenyl diphosphate synthase
MSNASTSSIPLHVGLILDGNRRWARARGLSTLQGHRIGYDNLKDIAKAAFNRGVGYVSAYIFSTENWDRTKREVNYLMNLAYRMLTKDVHELNEENIKIIWLGSPEKLSAKLVQAIASAEELTKNNTKGTLCICFNYGGKQEIADSFNQLMKTKKSKSVVTVDDVNNNIYHPEVPPVDLVIRTSNERRFSGFMLWRLTYAEFYFVKKYWPDFSVADLSRILRDYSKRDRRFGQ